MMAIGLLSVVLTISMFPQSIWAQAIHNLTLGDGRNHIEVADGARVSESAHHNKRYVHHIAFCDGKVHNVPGRTWKWIGSQCTEHHSNAYHVYCIEAVNGEYPEEVGTIAEWREICPANWYCIQQPMVFRGRETSWTACVPPRREGDSASEDDEEDFANDGTRSSVCSNDVEIDQNQVNPVGQAQVQFTTESYDWRGHPMAVYQTYYQDWTLGFPGEKLGIKKWLQKSTVIHTFTSAVLVVKFCADVGNPIGVKRWPKFKFRTKVHFLTHGVNGAQPLSSSIKEITYRSKGNQHGSP